VINVLANAKEISVDKTASFQPQDVWKTAVEIHSLMPETKLMPNSSNLKSKLNQQVKKEKEVKNHQLFQN
jgi:hypothetical protein